MLKSLKNDLKSTLNQIINVMTTVKVVHKPKFSYFVDSLDVSGLQWLDLHGCFFGTIEINGATWTGEHAANDYEPEFGFILEK